MAQGDLPEQMTHHLTRSRLRNDVWNKDNYAPVSGILSNGFVWNDWVAKTHFGLSYSDYVMVIDCRSVHETAPWRCFELRELHLATIGRYCAGLRHACRTKSNPKSYDATAHELQKYGENRFPDKLWSLWRSTAFINTYATEYRGSRPSAFSKSQAAQVS